MENDDKIAVEINTMVTTKNRKNYQPEFKAKVALEAVRGRLIIFPKQSNAEVSNARRICSLREKRAFSNIFLNSTNAQASPSVVPASITRLKVASIGGKTQLLFCTNSIVKTFPHHPTKIEKRQPENIGYLF